MSAIPEPSRVTDAGPERFADLETRVLAAERLAAPSAFLGLLRFGTHVLAAGHFLLFVVVVPSWRLRTALAGSGGSIISALVNGGLIILSVSWGAARTTRIWLNARLQLAYLFGAPRTAAARRSSPAEEGAPSLITSDLAGTIAESSWAPAFVRTLHHVRRNEDEVERRLDECIKSRGTLRHRIKRALVLKLMTFGLGIALTAGLMLVPFVLQQLPTTAYAGIPELVVGFAGLVGSIASGALFCYALYHPARNARRMFSLRMLEELVPTASTAEAAR